MKNLFSLAVAAAALGLGTIAEAQRPGLQLNTEPARTAQPIAYAKIGRDWKIKGDWTPIRQEGQTPQAPSWVNAFDYTNADPLNPAALNNNFYGLPSGQWWFGPLYNNPFFINDMNLNPPTSGRSAKFISADIDWNPDGTDPMSGSAKLIYVVFNGHGFNPLLDFMDDGLAIDFGVLPAGRWYLTVNFDLAPVAIGIGLPNVGGYTLQAMGTEVGGFFAQLPAPGVCQWNIGNMCSPGDLFFPGTNPSSSSELCWQDDNPADFTMAANELYNMQFGAGFGVLEPIVGLFVDDNAPVIQGQITLQDLDPFTLRPVQSIRVVITDAGTFDVVNDQVVALGPSGEYEILAPLNPGTYDVYAIPTHWLIRARFGVVFPGTSIGGVDISLENGDCDQDNEIAIGDFAIISASFGSSYDTMTGTPFPGPNGEPWDFAADLNHDDEVNIGDFGIMSANFGLTGD